MAPPRPPQIDWTPLIEGALRARAAAHAPYSRFQVGAALLGESGRIFLGCNVENISFGLTICAERNAVAQAVLQGERRLLAVAIAGGGEAPCPPCGACRQVLAEFADAELAVALVGGSGERQIHRLGALLPFAFETLR